MPTRLSSRARHAGRFTREIVLPFRRQTTVQRKAFSPGQRKAFSPGERKAFSPSERKAFSFGDGLSAQWDTGCALHLPGGPGDFRRARPWGYVVCVVCIRLVRCCLPGQIGGLPRVAGRERRNSPRISYRRGHFRSESPQVERQASILLALATRYLFASFQGGGRVVVLCDGQMLRQAPRGRPARPRRLGSAVFDRRHRVSRCRYRDRSRGRIAPRVSQRYQSDNYPFGHRKAIVVVAPQGLAFEQLFCFRSIGIEQQQLRLARARPTRKARLHPNPCFRNIGPAVGVEHSHSAYRPAGVGQVRRRQQPATGAEQHGCRHPKRVRQQARSAVHRQTTDNRLWRPLVPYGGTGLRFARMFSGDLEGHAPSWPSAPHHRTRPQHVPCMFSVLRSMLHLVSAVGCVGRLQTEMAFAAVATVFAGGLGYLCRRRLLAVAFLRAMAAGVSIASCSPRPLLHAGPSNARRVARAHIPAFR